MSVVVVAAVAAVDVRYVGNYVKTENAEVRASAEVVVVALKPYC